MLDADPRASRSSGARGPAQAQVRWTFSAGAELSEPLVLPDGRIVVSAASGRSAVTRMLSPGGEVLQGLPGVGLGGVAPVLSPHGLLFLPAGDSSLVALAVEAGQKRWSRELARRPDLLRGTPAGDVLVFTREDRFLCVSRHGSPRWGALQDLTGTKSGALAAFDGKGHCYTAESGIVFQRGTEVTWRSGVSVLSPEGEELGSELFEPTDGANTNAVEHIWGQDEGAVLFGQVIRGVTPTGETRWWISRAEDFARTVEVEGRVLGWDPRLAGGPRWVVLREDGGFEFLAAATDAQGASYACAGNRVLSVDGEGRPRWRLELPEPALGGPVVGPEGTLLVRGARTLFCLG